MGFDGFPWHIHGDMPVARYSGTPEEAARRYVADLISNKLIIAVSKIDGDVRDVWVTEEPAQELRFCPTEETIAFRLWDGKRVEV